MEDVVAIDGPAGSGKSSVSRAVARRLGWVYLDTGAMYRAVALAAKRLGVDPGDGSGLGSLCRGLDLRLVPDGGRVRLFLGEEEVSGAIRTPEMDMLSSAVSAVPAVREAMTGLQRRMGEAGRVVAEGRDMGTVVFPRARYKFFLTASPAVRAERRYRERLARGEKVEPARVTEEMQRRDRQDASRSVAPLRAAEDARVIDTSDMSLEQVISLITQAVRSAA
jgi:cytidylate kinase